VKNRLWLALRLPDLPLVSFPAHPDEQAVCVLEKQRVIYANTAALGAGVDIDMDVTTARLLSDCITYQRDMQREQEYMEQLTAHLYAFTPYVHIRRSNIAPDSGLLLEISRCLKLFGGLKNLYGKIAAAMADIPTTYGLAHTEEGAWLLSYDNRPISGDENPADFIARLNHVPIARLADWPDEVEALKRTGFNTLGDISRQIETQSISSIKKRLGKDFADFITRLFGIEQNFQQTALFEKPVQTYQPKEFFFDTMQFDYPITQIEQLHTPLEQMLQQLGEFLRKRKLACQKVEWRLFDIYQNSHHLSVHCAIPQNTWKLFYDLTLIQLESQQLPFAVDAIELTCQHLQKWQEQNQSLDFSGRRSKNRGGNDLALLEGKLKARLGEQAIFKVSYKDSHIPEQTCEKLSAFTPVDQQLPQIHQHALRPTWLFENPLPVNYQQQTLSWRGKLQLLTGPERIEGYWWAAPKARDYYIAAREDGLRVWIYKDLVEGSWFVQGVFAA
jgi:impB/mucB/samB family./impB/mucB/samB family C-terminal.